MPGCRCAVFGCNNSLIATKARGENVIYHNFPKGTDLVSKTTRSEWVQRCRRADKWNSNTSRICSVHFCDDDYERDLQNELLGLPIRRILKKTAVPTVNLPTSDSPRQRRLRKKKEEGRSPITVPDPEPSTSQANEENLSDSHSDYQVKYEELLSTHNKMRRDFQHFKRRCRRKIKSLNDQLKYYKNKCAKLNKQKEEDRATNLLTTILTENQITLLLDKKKRVNWT